MRKNILLLILFRINMEKSHYLPRLYDLYRGINTNAAEMTSIVTVIPSICLAFVTAK